MNEHHRILAITSHLPAALLLSRAKPLNTEWANKELINDDEGKISIRAGDVEQSVWMLWPDATHASVGGDGMVHVFKQGAIADWQDSRLEALREFLA